MSIPCNLSCIVSKPPGCPGISKVFLLNSVSWVGMSGLGPKASFISPARSGDIL